MRDFKAGDVVVCVYSPESDGLLIEREAYDVTAIERGLLGLEGVDQGVPQWSPARFQLQLPEEES